MIPSIRKIGAVLLLIGLVALVGLLLWLAFEEMPDWKSIIIDENTHPALFMALFLLLPLIGFPVSALLVILGVKFGAWAGVTIMFAGMPVHLTVSFFVAHSLLRAPLIRLLARMGRSLPQIPEERQARFCLLFMAVPGLSYTLKNYLLPLSGVPFRYFFLSGLVLQGVMGIPFVVAGDAAAKADLLLLGALLLVFLIAFGAFRWVRGRVAGEMADSASNRRQVEEGHDST